MKGNCETPVYFSIIIYLTEKMCIFLIHIDVTLVLIEELVFKLTIYKDKTSKSLFIFKFFI